MTWAVYYDDGVVLSGGAMSGLRSTGVVVIAQADDRVGREVISGNEWYYFRDGKFYGANRIGIEYQILYHLGDLQWIGQGAMVSHEMYERLQIQACDSPGLPPMSGKRPGQQED